MDQIPFFKMSACGNDFCVIDNREGKFPNPPATIVKNICKRKIALGADGLILVEKSESASFKMRFFNSDGGEVEMCGNGARCVARFAYINEIAPQQMNFETKAGTIWAEVSQDVVRIGLEEIRFVQKDARVSLQDILPGTDCYFITVGVPHVVCFMKDIEGMDVEEAGRKIRSHTLFQPNGTNANFITVTGPRSLTIRTYERGVEAETLACGTGSTASALVASALGFVTQPVEVITRSGCPLRIGCEREGEIFKEIWLEGEARVVCDGELWIDEIIP
jgi:diaminopimelate epimerase